MNLFICILNIRFLLSLIIFNINRPCLMILFSFTLRRLAYNFHLWDWSLASRIKVISCLLLLLISNWFLTWRLEIIVIWRLIQRRLFVIGSQFQIFRVWRWLMTLDVQIITSLFHLLLYVVIYYVLWSIVNSIVWQSVLILIN